MGICYKVLGKSKEAILFVIMGFKVCHFSLDIFCHVQFVIKCKYSENLILPTLDKEVIFAS